jgi:hypothetical protein
MRGITWGFLAFQRNTNTPADSYPQALEEKIK